MKHIVPAETGDDEGEGLLVRRIKNGTVIDHIDGGEALNVIKILGIVGTTLEALSIATNVPSRHMGKKDIVKISNRELQKRRWTGSRSSLPGRPSISSGTSRSVKSRASRSRR